MNAYTSKAVITCVFIIAAFGSLTTCMIVQPETPKILKMRACLERPDMKWETTTWGVDKCVLIEEKEN